jgi:hypothetical protein
MSMTSEHREGRQPRTPATTIGERERASADERKAGHGDAFARTEAALIAVARAKGLSPTKAVFIDFARNFAARHQLNLDRLAMRRRDCLLCFFCEHPEWQTDEFFLPPPPEERFPAPQPTWLSDDQMLLDCSSEGELEPLGQL